MVWLTPVLGIVMMCVECVEGAPKKVGQKAGTNQQTRQEKSTKKHRLRQARYQMTRMTERMFEGFTHNHEVMVLGRRALDVLMSSRSLGDELALYRGRLQRFQEALHIRFVDECICWLVDDSKGPVPNHELRALRITAARRSPCRGREFVMEQALLRPVARNFGRRYCDCRLQREALLDEMTSEPLPLAREDLGKGEVVV